MICRREIQRQAPIRPVRRTLVPIRGLRKRLVPKLSVEHAIADCHRKAWAGTATQHKYGMSQMRKRIRKSPWAGIFRRSVATLTRRAAKTGTRVVKRALKAAVVKGTPPPGAGAWSLGVAVGTTGARRFRLYRPPDVKLSERLPLVVMLHGCGQDANGFATSTRMNRIAMRERFLVLYPEQDRLVNPQGCWNWFDTSSGRAFGEAGLIMQAIDQVCQLHPVDSTRVAIAGLSAGASMAALLVTLHPGRFKAVVMHSGIAPGTAHSTLSVMGAMHGHRATLPLAATPVTSEPTGACMERWRGEQAFQRREGAGRIAHGLGLCGKAVPCVRRLAARLCGLPNRRCAGDCLILNKGDRCAACRLAQFPDHFQLEINMNYEDRDSYGMYKASATNASGPDASRGPDASHGPGPNLMGADTLVGNDVYNKDFVDVGDIKEIMINMNTGRVSYAVLSFGGFLGVGEKLFAVPWEALKLDTTNKRFELDVNKERLEGAPGFDKNKWPDMADKTWEAGIHAYYGTQPYSEPTRV